MYMQSTLLSHTHSLSHSLSLSSSNPWALGYSSENSARRCFSRGRSILIFLRVCWLAFGFRSESVGSSTQARRSGVHTIFIFICLAVRAGGVLYTREREREEKRGRDRQDSEGKREEKGLCL